MLGRYCVGSDTNDICSALYIHTGVLISLWITTPPAQDRQKLKGAGVLTVSVIIKPPLTLV